MKKQMFITILLLSTIVLSAQNTDQEKEAIKKVIQTAYVEGLQNEGDAEKIELGFHPDFYMLGIGNGNSMWKYSISDWKAKVVQKRKSGELPNKGSNIVSVKFKSIDVTNTAASVKLDFFIGEKHTYTDYMLLYKFGDSWKIVSKIFTKK
ncbi:MAG: nuclear transport factor 2 family protein [Chlorobi bacterium]|nr:nuclear transport factor 2 family protein [Chlorobiota bacterium]